MIVSRDHDFGFVHIAKCAGSTIRHQLREMDDFRGCFYRSVTHPTLGRINGNHIPLATLANHFTDAFDALQEVTSYTVTRDPLGRFISGVSQLVRDRGREPSELDVDETRAIAKEAMDYMRTAPPLPAPEYILFAPQRDYVDLAGRRIVNHIFPMNSLDALFDTLERDHGLVLERDQVWNPTVTYRFPAMANGLKALKDIARERLPVRAYAQLRDLGVKAFTTKGAPKFEDTLRSDPAVTSFIDTFYAGDRELHAEALAAREPSAIEA